VRGNNAPDFGVRAIGDDESSLDLHFRDSLLVLFRLCKDPIIF
jgi:hypothetical protein